MQTFVTGPGEFLQEAFEQQNFNRQLADAGQ